MSNSLFDDNGMYHSDFKGTQRSCYRGMKVRVYRNLNKPQYLSLIHISEPTRPY